MISESITQKALIKWARTAAKNGVCEAPDGRTLRLEGEQREALALLHHSRNGGMSKAENGRSKAMGTVAGWPDLFLPLPRLDTKHTAGKHFIESLSGGLFIEMKAKGGRVSAAQKDVLARLEAAGYAVQVCYGYDDARAAILDYFDLLPDDFS